LKNIEIGKDQNYLQRSHAKVTPFLYRIIANNE